MTTTEDQSDFDRRLRAEAALRESEARFLLLADSISQLAWMANSDPWILWYNRHWFDHTGTMLRDMEGWGWRNVHHPDHVDRVVARVQKSWETGDPERILCRCAGMTASFAGFCRERCRCMTKTATWRAGSAPTPTLPKSAKRKNASICYSTN